jgi:hypothetical protein
MMNDHNRFPRTALQTLQIVLIVLLAACARQGTPPGGPVDRMPPRIMATWPRPDTTRVPLDSKITLQFNEAVEHRTCEESIFITPRPAESVRFKWQGKKLEVMIPGGLLPHRTYVITVGTGTRDLRNLAMASSYALAFSTGDSLDRGALAGRIYSDNPVEGVQIWAYELNGNQAPNPAAAAPLYVTQANARGTFALEYLAFGTYRLFAVGDRDLNGRYDAERELLGVAARDFTLSAGRPRVEQITLRAVLRDTTPPLLAGASAPDNRHVDLRFSERMDARGLTRPENIRISAAGETLRIIDRLIDKRSAAYLHLLTGSQKAGVDYTVTILEGWDLAGHALSDTGRTTTFKGATLADSIKPYFISALPEDKARNVPLQNPVTLAFSEAMNDTLAGWAFTLLDSSKKAVPGRITWPNSAEMLFQPDSLLKPEHPYLVRLAVDSLRDLQGNTVSDTLIQIHFQTLNPDTLSEIAGSLRDEAAGRSGSFFLRAFIPKGPVYELTSELEGAYHFVGIFPGEYLIDYFRDEDSNGSYSYGRAFPWQPAERYAFFPDTIKVRARWPNEGNDLLLPE